MRCRRCHADIVDGSDICPLCGIKQTTFTVPRRYDPRRGRGKLKKNTLVPLVVMGVVILAVYIITGFIQKYTQSYRLEQVRQTYERLRAAQEDGTFQEGDDGDLFLQVGQFIKNYPGTPEADEVQAYLESIRQGVLPAPPEIDPAEARMQALRAELEKGTVRIIRYEQSGPGAEQEYDMSVRWQNVSGKTISEIYFLFEAMDAQGNAAPCAKRGTADASLKTAGPFAPSDSEYKQSWLNVWYNDGDIRAKLVGVYIRFADKSDLRVPQELLDYVYRE